MPRALDGWPADQSQARLWWTIGGTAFLLRLTAAIVTGSLWHPESYEYDALARALLAGRGFTYTHLDIVYHSFAAPLYSWITAALYWLTGGSAVPLVLLQIAAGSALAVVVAAMSEHLFESRVAAAAAGLLVAVHPGLALYNTARLHPLTFDALFFTFVLWQFFRLSKQSTMARAAALGLIVGVGMLSRATTLIFFPIGAAWLLAMAPRESRGRAAGRLLVAAVCATVIVAPWSIRNTRLHHQFVLLQTTDSELLWRGNNPNATGHSYIDAGHIVLNTLPPDAQQELRSQPDELAQSRWFRARAMAYIEEHPDAFVRLTALKFFHFWWFAPQTGVLYPRTWLRLYQAYYVGILLLAVIGAAALVRSTGAVRREALLLALFLLALSGLQSLYYVEGRHRWAVEPMMLAVSGGGVAALLSRRKTSAVHPA